MKHGIPIVQIFKLQSLDYKTAYTQKNLKENFPNLNLCSSWIQLWPLIIRTYDDIYDASDIELDLFIFEIEGKEAIKKHGSCSSLITSVRTFEIEYIQDE